MPYDPPSQAAWMEAPGRRRLPALEGRRRVTSFSGYGMGSYSFFNQGIDIFAANAFEVPDTLPASSLNDLLTIFLDPRTARAASSTSSTTPAGPRRSPTRTSRSPW
jgi:hypothetical protein